MKASPIRALVLVGTLCVSAPALAESVFVQLKGHEEVPSISTGARGSFRAEVNSAAGTIAYQLSYSGLQGDVRQARRHRAFRQVSSPNWSAPSVPAWLTSTCIPRPSRAARSAASSTPGATCSGSDARLGGAAATHERAPCAPRSAAARMGISRGEPLQPFGATAFCATAGFLSSFSAAAIGASPSSTSPALAPGRSSSSPRRWPRRLASV